ECSEGQCVGPQTAMCPMGSCRRTTNSQPLSILLSASLPSRSALVLTVIRKSFGFRIEFWRSTGTGFQQMGRPTVANQVWANPLANAGSAGRLRTCKPHRLVGDGLLAITILA